MPAARRGRVTLASQSELIYESVQSVKDAGIGLQLLCIYGTPGETPEQTFQTLEMVDKIKPTQKLGVHASLTPSRLIAPFLRSRVLEIGRDLRRRR